MAQAANNLGRIRASPPALWLASKWPLLAVNKGTPFALPPAHIRVSDEAKISLVPSSNPTADLVESFSTDSSFDKGTNTRLRDQRNIFLITFFYFYFLNCFLFLGWLHRFCHLLFGLFPLSWLSFLTCLSVFADIYRWGNTACSLSALPQNSFAFSSVLSLLSSSLAFRVLLIILVPFALCYNISLQPSLCCVHLCLLNFPPPQERITLPRGNPLHTNSWSIVNVVI